MTPEQTMRRLRQAWGACERGSDAEAQAEAAIDTFAESAEWRDHLAKRRGEKLATMDAQRRAEWI